VIVPLGFGHLLCRTDGAAVEIHHVPVWRGVGKDHAATAPIVGWVWPGARRRIAYAALLRECQGNAALLQVRFAAAAQQGGLERGELLGEVGPCWSGRTRCWWIHGELPGCYRRLLGKPRWRLAMMWHALLAG
jgi:hypothetical protein